MSITLPKRQQGDFTNAAMILMPNATVGYPVPLAVLGWGNNTTGTLANGLTASTSVPIQEAVFDPNTTLPPDGEWIVDVAFTNANLYVVFSNGWVYSAGNNTYGQLGHGDTTSRPYLKRIEYFVTNELFVENVWAAGSASNTDGGGCVYFGAGFLYGCGANAAGNLGNLDNPTSNLSTPSLCSYEASPGEYFNIAAEAVQISAVSGNFSTYILAPNLIVAGYNGQGQLGVGTTSNVTGAFVNALANSGYLPPIIGISSTGGGGAGSALIMDNGGGLWTTGYNAYGQLGLGNTTNVNLFTPISTFGIDDEVQAAGIGGGAYGYAYAIDQYGVLYTWGYNAQNNLFQNRTTSPVTSPTTTVLPAGLVNSIIFPKDEALSTNAQMLAVISGNTQLVYAGVGNGQNGVTSTTYPATKFIPLSLLNTGDEETISDVFVHGTGATQRLFVLTSLGNLFAIGANADSVCTAGYCSNTMPTSVGGFNIAAITAGITLP